MGKITLMLMLLSVMSLTITTEGSVYQKHGISFEIPVNWAVVKDQELGNDTQIVLSDNVSAIRIDMIKMSDKEINKLVAEDYAKKRGPGESENPVDANTSWKLLYSLQPWAVVDGVNDYYMNNVIHLVTQLSNSGSGITITPDGAKDAGIATSYGIMDPIEWSIGWTKPEYDGKIMGVHALFSGNYTQQPIEWRGATQKYTVAMPLWTVLSTFTTGSKPKSSSLVGMD